MQHELPPAEKDTVNSGQILEIIFNSSEKTAISGIRRKASIRASCPAKTFPVTAVIFSSGSKAVKKVATRSWKPLKTDKVHTNANVAKATPQTEMAEITLMALCDFLEKR